MPPTNYRRTDFGTSSAPWLVSHGYCYSIDMQYLAGVRSGGGALERARRKDIFRFCCTATDRLLNDGQYDMISTTKRRGADRRGTRVWLSKAM